MNRFLQRAYRPLVALLFLAILALGLCTAGDYGVYCDELSEQVILQENLKEYALRLGMEEAAAYYDRLGVQRITQSAEIDHGQAAFYPLAWALPLCESDPATLHLLWHGYAWLLFTLGLAGMYLLLRELGLRRWTALAGMLTMLLSPRFFAEGHYNNKDVALLVFAIWCFLLALRLWKRPVPLRGALFSLAGALAANTKVVGLLIWGFLGLGAVICLTAGRRWNRRAVWASLTTLGVFCAAYVLLTPAMWNDPAEYLRYLLQNASGFTRWTGVVLFRGVLFDHQTNPLPRYYLPATAFLTTPLYFFPLAAAGQLAAFARWKKAPGKLLREPESLLLLCATLLWALFMGYVVLRRPLIYNGWRHFYFLYASFGLLAAYGLQALADRWNAGTVAVLAAVCLTVSAAGIAANHPYQYAYYNPLAPADAEETMELDYWDVSTVNALRALLSSGERNGALPAIVSGTDDMSQFGLDTGLSALTAEEKARLTVTSQQPDAPYLFSNTTYGRIYATQPPEGYRELFSLRSYGRRLCTVYERNGETRQ